MTRRYKCDVCRFRKIKCDETRPTCGPCEKGGRPCTYNEAESAQSGIQVRTVRRAPNGKGAFITFVSGENTSNTQGSDLAPSSEDIGLAPCSYQQFGNYPQFRLVTFERSALPQPKRGIPDLASASAFREQLVMLYLDNYSMSNNLSVKEVAAAYGNWLAPNGKTMQASIDSILLLHLSRITGQRRVAVAGQSRYSHALVRLGNDIRAGDAAWDDGVLGATHALTIAAQYRRLALTAEHWAAHIHGLETILKARGPACLRSNLARIVILVSVSRIIMNAVQLRRPHFFGEAQWQAALGPLCLNPQAQIELATARLPALLAQVDQLISRPRASHSVNIKPLLTKLSGWKDDAHAWLHTHYTDRRICRPVARGIDSNYENAPELLRSHLVGYPFEETYTFTDPHSSFLHLWYWIVLLQAASAELDLMKLDRAKPDDTSLARAREQCGVFAGSLCKLVPYLRSIGNMPGADIVASKGIEFAEEWFEKTGNQEKVTWCRETRRSLEEGAEVFLDSCTYFARTSRYHGK